METPRPFSGRPPPGRQAAKLLSGLRLSQIHTGCLRPARPQAPGGQAPVRTPAAPDPRRLPAPRPSQGARCQAPLRAWAAPNPRLPSARAYTTCWECCVP
ncbi:hypothetical protein U9M48_043129 [Paspalum notatum var. saurae]|uniref:Uncharacterized protein n=1 Tax=Paspalum notatum var. saurae TaxID=547442 RepID=A0AAQ3UWM1_PASNO